MFDCFQAGWIVVDGVIIGDYEFRINSEGKLNPIAFLY